MIVSPTETGAGPTPMTRQGGRSSSETEHLELTQARGWVWLCAARSRDPGVNDSSFYWIDPNEIAVITDAEPGAWGPGSGAELSARAAKAIFGLADLARNTSTETWADARSGEEMSNRAQ